MLWAILKQAEEAASAHPGSIVATRHYYLLERNHTAQVLTTARTQAVTFSDLRMYGLAAVSPLVEPLPDDVADLAFGLGSLRAIAAGLDDLHASGLVFADVKPDNVGYVQRKNEDPVFRLLDIDSLAVAVAPPAVLRTTPIFSLPAVRQPNTLQTPNAKLLQANDRFGFIGVVITLLSGQKVAQAVLNDNTYDDEHVPLDLRQEIERKVEQMRGGNITPFTSCATWLHTLEQLKNTPAPVPLPRTDRDPDVDAFLDYWERTGRMTYDVQGVFDRHCHQVAEAAARKARRTVAAVLLDAAIHRNHGGHLRC